MTIALTCVFLIILSVIFISIIMLFDKIENIKNENTKPVVISNLIDGCIAYSYLPLDDQEKYDVIVAKAKARVEAIERNKDKIIKRNQESESKPTISRGRVIMEDGMEKPTPPPTR